MAAPEEELHYPPGAEPEAPAPEPPKVDPPKEETPKEDTPPEPPKAEPEKKEDEPPAEPPPQLPKKRSIYDDLKDERKERKSLEARNKELEEENSRLKSAPPPKEEPTKEETPKDDLDAYAKEHNLDTPALARLVEIIQKRIPPAQLSDDEKKGLADLKTFQQERQRLAEDQEILTHANAVKDQLQVHDPAELDKVMQEIVKLAHTERFHDKEVGYIVWANREALAKLVSPKKPSFERGGQDGEAQPEKIDFSSGKVTPEQVGKAMEHPKTTYEIRRAQ